jgi:hypothetical protein
VRAPETAGNGLAKVTVSVPYWKAAVVAPLTLELPVVVAPRRHPAETKGIRSTNSDVETSIQFANRSGQAIKVYWLDFEGHRQLKHALRDGESTTVRRTFLTHPWLVTDEADNAWYVYFPDALPRSVEVVEPLVFRLQAWIR